MNSIKIAKQKHIQFCLLTMTAIILMFLTALWYLLALGTVDWVFNLKYTIIFISVFVGDVVIPLCVFFILRFANKSYYIISSEYIKLFNGNEEAFTIPVKSVWNLGYKDFKYAFLMQMGAGYLRVSFCEACGKIKPTMTFPDGKMLLGIDMTAKQAEQVARILGKDLQK